MKPRTGSLAALGLTLTLALSGCEAINEFVKEVDARAEPAAEEARKSMKKVEQGVDENVTR